MCAIPRLSLILVFLGVDLANAYSVGSTRQVRCPMEYDVPLADGRPSHLRLNSVANFMLPKVQDRWWTEGTVKQFYQPRGRKFRIGKSKIAGCGIIANARISAGERIGLVWVKDPDADKAGDFAYLVPRHFTPWFGRAVNHCNTPNSHLEEDRTTGEVYSVATQDISVGDEVTGDYNEAAKDFPGLVERAPPDWTC